MMEFVHWDHDIPNCFWKVISHKSRVSNHQPDIHIVIYNVIYIYITEDHQQPWEIYMEILAELGTLRIQGDVVLGMS